MKKIEIDCLIIGTGIAGCSAALELANAGRNVMLLTRSERPSEAATAWAQGGVVFQGKEKGGLLEKDIMEAGAGLSNPKAVHLLSTEGPDLVKRILIDQLNVPFSRNSEGKLDLTREAAHSVARILHSGDETGKTIEQAFLQHLSKNKKIEIRTRHTAIDLITPAHHSTNPQDIYEPSRCIGAYLFDQAKGEVIAVLAKETILATGGLGQLYLHSTNPPGARGDGLAMAYRTGARIMNLEYIQFHPTALYSRNPERFLISEAMRGEGARLTNQRGEEFMSRYDSRGTLAPRDIVCRAIAEEMLREESRWVYLDISQKPADWIRSRFPSIHAQCLQLGIDITTQPIPVVPAAHYSCGGVAVDLNGKTTIENLWAVGEVACSGVHGANRLASTSLLEGLVWGTRAGQAASEKISKDRRSFPAIRDWEGEAEPVEMSLLTQDWQTIKQTMWNYVGLIRTPRRLERAKKILGALADEVEEFYAHSVLSDELIGLRNAAAAAQLVLTAARRNHHSLGCHFISKDLS